MQKLRNEIGYHLSNPLLLKDPNGKEWKIIWTKHDGDIWFQKGWKEFAKYYSLADGYFVTFKREKETCRFGVKIYDLSQMEIKYPVHGSQGEQHNLNQISEETSVEVLDEQPDVI